MRAESQVNSSVVSTRSHLLNKGDAVTIIGLALFGRPYIEGKAQIEAAVPGIPNLYRVRFAGDTRLRERYVHLEFQADPERVLGALLDIWRASLTPEILTEFFPGDGS